MATPSTLADLPEYVVVKFGVIEKNKREVHSLKQNKTKCFISVHSKLKDMNGLDKEETLIGEEYTFDSEIVNFSDEQMQQVRVTYDRETL